MTSEMREHVVEHPSAIKPNIWLGNKANAYDLEKLKEIGITHILNCAQEIDPKVLPINLSIGSS